MTEKVNFTRRLTARILIFLTVAMVPLGVIGVVQSQRLGAEMSARAELSLLALTDQAAFGERQVIQRAFGAAKAMGDTIDLLRETPEQCGPTLRRFLSADTGYVFTGYINMDGISPCSSSGEIIDFSNSPGLEEALEHPRPSVDLVFEGQESGIPVLVITQPHFKGGAMHGLIAISVALDHVESAPDFTDGVEPVSLITFNRSGQILSSHTDRRGLDPLLPLDLDLAALAQDRDRTYTAQSRSGRDLVYSVVTIVPGVVYALGTWNPHTIGTGFASPAVLTIVLPALMWLASLLVAWFAIHRFVVDRIKDLNADMKRFALNRTVPQQAPASNMSLELAELNTAFTDMARDIVQDEMEQADRLREKSIFLKEIHHRVKNNLQIISSIMNMQIRKATEEETRLSLGKVQDRILGLSNVHQTLYKSENLTKIDASMLIQQFIDQSRRVADARAQGIDISLEMQPIPILPDQAVPLTMFVSEALNNALQYIDPDNGFLKIGLASKGARHVRLVLENAISPDRQETTPADPAKGLGRQLMRAFALQLDGTLKSHPAGEVYRVELDFVVQADKGAPRDY